MNIVGNSLDFSNTRTSGWEPLVSIKMPEYTLTETILQKKCIIKND
jgi:hypothetical protein